jgi:hypothetical protein
VRAVGRLGLAALLLVPAALPASPYRPPVEAAPKGTPQAWILKKKGVGRWCAFTSRRAVEAALESGDYDEDDRAALWLAHGRLTAIMVSNDSEDSMADDVYYLDARRKVTRMVRTGHYVENPMFSVTFAPDWTGRLVMTPASREVVRLMEQAGYESYIIDWPRFAGFDRMPFRNLIGHDPVVTMKQGCAWAAS